MVHNGIEYALMQMIAEAYDLLRRGAGYSNSELHQIFTGWNSGKLQSFLIEVTAAVFNTGDEATPGNDDFLIDKILDQAGSKGTGKWTSQEGMNLPVAIPSIDMAVAMRDLSVYKEQRVAAAKLYPASFPVKNINKEALITDLEDALQFSFIMAYAQGLSMLAKASADHAMDIPLLQVVQVWKAGCIIRSAMLENFEAAFSKDKGLPNILLDESVANLIKPLERSTRRIVATAVESKIPVAAISSAVAYFDAYCSERLPMNLVQAQRDYFGAHTYRRTDKEGVFHTEWNS
jgi:6-phosphogluconate dehydrogenase